jgi:hypothetical protein
MADSNYYLAPPFINREGHVPSADEQLSWVKEFLQQAKSYLRLQPAHPYIQDGLDLVNGDFAKSSVATLSNARTDLVVRNEKELIASQSNLRIVPSISTNIDEFKKQAALLNKCWTYWMGKTFADRVIRQAWQNAVALGTGYCSIGYDPDYYCAGSGEIAPRAHGPLDVLPIGLPHDHDLQKAYAVAIKVPTPYHQAIRMFPDFADQIKPTTEMKGRGTVMAQSVKFASAVLKRFGPTAIQDREPMPWAMVDLYYIYIDDRSVNHTGKTLLMGAPYTSWEYTVPSIGDLIETGQDADGKITYKQATAEDCRFYPNRRRIVATDNLILTPDPTLQVNPSWHGKVPVVQFRADDWPWMFLGFPLSKAGMLLEKANIELLRGMVDMMNVRLSPPTGYDRNTMARSLAETINLRVPNQRLGLDYTLGGEQFKPLISADYLTVPTVIPELMAANEGRITNLMGVADAAALARARQLPAGDSTERLLEALGPLVKDMSRNMELSVTGLGNMWVPLVFQWWKSGKRFQIFGDDGLVEEDVDFNPGSMVPQEMPDLPKHSSYFERAKRHCVHFPYAIEPYSLHELNSLTRKMAFLQLSRSGFPISWRTLARVWDVKNFGFDPKNRDENSPDYGRPLETEFELWLAQQEIMARIAMAMGGGGGKGKGPQGRPPTAQEPPSLALKPGGRSTIRESRK